MTHDAQLHADVINATKESERDMYALPSTLLTPRPSLLAPLSSDKPPPLSLFPSLPLSTRPPRPPRTHTPRYDQRNQQLQTIIVSSSVIVAAITTLLIQGIIPQGSDPTLIICFGASCGVSYALLFLSVVLCIETLRLASSFMVKRAKSTGVYAFMACVVTCWTCLLTGATSSLLSASGAGDDDQELESLIHTEAHAFLEPRRRLKGGSRSPLSTDKSNV